MGVDDNGNPVGQDPWREKGFFKRSLLVWDWIIIRLYEYNKIIKIFENGAHTELIKKGLSYQDTITQILICKWACSHPRLFSVITEWKL